MSKCVPILDRMPPEIMEKIVGYTDSIDKFRLRQCCKYFKQIVDNSEIVFNSLEFCWKNSQNLATISVSITGRQRIRKVFNDKTPKDKSPIENAMLALKFLEKVLKSHSKIRLVNLKFNVPFKSQELMKHREMLVEEVWRIFSGFENKLPVETLWMLWMRDEQLLMRVLPHLVPGTLHELNFTNAYFADTRINLSRIVETKQWKQAKVLGVDRNYLSICVGETDHFDIMEYSVDRVEVNDVKRIVENILRKNGWKKRSIYPNEYDFDALKQYLSQFDRQMGDTDPNNEENDDLRMTIRRDGYKCKIEMNRTYRHMTFERVH